MVFLHLADIVYMNKPDMNHFLKVLGCPEKNNAIFNHGKEYGKLLLHVGQGYAVNSEAKLKPFWEKLANAINEKDKIGRCLKLCVLTKR